MAESELSSLESDSEENELASIIPESSIGGEDSKILSLESLNDSVSKEGTQELIDISTEDRLSSENVRVIPHVERVEHLLNENNKDVM